MKGNAMTNPEMADQSIPPEQIDLNNLASLMIGHGARALVKLYGHAKALDLIKDLVLAIEEEETKPCQS